VYEREAATLCTITTAHDCGLRLVYDTPYLRSLRFTAPVPLAAETVARISSLRLRRHCGCRAGRVVKSGRRPLPRLQSAGNGAYVITGNRPSPRLVRTDRAFLVSVSVSRHTETTGRALTFGCINIRSLSPSKLDDLLDIARDRRVDVLLFCSLSLHCA